MSNSAKILLARLEPEPRKIMDKIIEEAINIKYSHRHPYSSDHVQELVELVRAYAEATAEELLKEIANAK